MPGFRHEALLYAGEQEFLDGTLPFIRDSVAAAEPILVVVGARKLELLRARLNGDADGVLLADMGEVGDNPARIIPAWRDFVADHSAPGRLRGIGEPIGPDRGPAELVECHRHESLLNLAFADAADLWLMCPYDTEALDAAVVAEAHHTHPYVVAKGARLESRAWGGPEHASLPFDATLPEPAGEPRELRFDLYTLPLLRRFVSRLAVGLLDARRVGDLQLAVNEVATNSVRHGGGHGVLRIWHEPDRVICEVRDKGAIDRPLAGREEPAADRQSGHGLWLANQVCDLLQLRSFADGTVARLHMRT